MGWVGGGNYDRSLVSGLEGRGCRSVSLSPPEHGERYDAVHLAAADQASFRYWSIPDYA